MTYDLSLIIVDDDLVNLILLEELVKQCGYTNYNTFTQAQEAWNYIQNHHVDALVTDFNMPKINGIELLKFTKKIYPDLVSIMITANNDEEMMQNALSCGVTEFLLKPISSITFKLRLKNILETKSSLNNTQNFNKILKQKVDKVTKALQKSEYEALEVLSKAAEYKDPETASHIARVSHYSKLLAKVYGLSIKEQDIIYYAAPLHDIGKIGIIDDILLKPGKLSPDEFNEMKRHSMIGAEILSGKANIFLKAGEIIALSHHERYDGGGYPNGLKANAIPLYGRIVAIADVFDALTSKRPYKEAWSFDKALDLLVNQKGKHFDSTLVELFVKNITEVKVIYKQFQEN